MDRRAVAEVNSEKPVVAEIQAARLRLVAERSPSADAVPVVANLEDAHLWLVARGENR